MPNPPDPQPRQSRQEMADIIRAKEKENTRLRREIQDLRRQLMDRDELIQDTDGVEDEDDPPQPIDSSDGGEPDSFRCTSCAWEVIQGICQGCGLEHAYDAEREDEIYQRLHGSISTAETLTHSDRQLPPRGTTPLLEVETFIVPLQYRGSREDEFCALLARGASRLMCETFHLEYTPEGGIVAWADTDLFEEFSGPKMKKGHFWKICLGRRIILDEDDMDGSQFIEGLVEEAMVFPISESRRKPWGMWETVLEENTKDTIWVTRPVSGAFPESHGDDDTSGDEDEDEDDWETSSGEVDSSQADDDNDDEGDDDADGEGEGEGYADVESIEPDESVGPEEQEEDLIINDYEASNIGSDDMEVDFEPAWYYSPSEGTDEPDEDQDSQEMVDQGHADEGQAEPNDGAHAIDIEPPLEDGVSESSADSDFDMDEELSGDEEVLRDAPVNLLPEEN
ncbi:hypothetical protein DENSPDRAFT_868594 [Dentipellis sp. KUC8613]|nr:hypothetical protein DENSPDRAFT_868594 [Dentipellis sp. KUC8613]